MGIIGDKSFQFAISIVKVCRRISSQSREYDLSRQLLRSGTAIGALYREAEYAESKKDFIHKLAISQKECNETLYWLDLLKETDFLDLDTYKLLKKDGTELMKMITSGIKTAKSNLKTTKS